MLVCAFFSAFARETAGAARTRSSLRPLFSEGGTLLAKLARNAWRDREGMPRPLNVIASEAIQLFLVTPGLLRVALNDDINAFELG
jgi:hypothetical protein